MPVIYSAVQRFDPTCDDKWTKFIEWCGLTQLREVISLDGILCPSVIVIDDLTTEDWRAVSNPSSYPHIKQDHDKLRKAFALAAGLSDAVELSKIIVTAGQAEVAAGAIAIGLGGCLAERTDAEHFVSERASEERETQERPVAILLALLK